MLRYGFHTGAYPTIQPDWILDDLVAQNQKAADLDNFLAGNPTASGTTDRSFEYRIIWDVYRWVNSTGADAVYHFTSARDGVG
jgi:hypothetical protein